MLQVKKPYNRQSIIANWTSRMSIDIHIKFQIFVKKSLVISNQYLLRSEKNISKNLLFVFMTNDVINL